MIGCILRQSIYFIYIAAKRNRARMKVSWDYFELRRGKHIAQMNFMIGCYVACVP